MTETTAVESGLRMRGRPRLGAEPLRGGRCRFRVWAPEAERVEVVLGEQGERAEALEPGRRGYHGAVLEDVEPGTPYRYRLDGGEPLPDPASRHQPDGVHGPSAVVDPRFDWTDGGWSGVELEDLVLYEIHVGAFTPEGTFDAIVPRLAELADLGVTAIELMPVAAFPGERNWGYDGVFPYAVEASYGGPDGLKRLVDAAHGAGLGVVLDVVHNHLGPEGNVLGRYGPYFTDRYETPWGDAINFDGAGSDEVRRFFVESAVAWVRDYHVDGLRLDAVHAILDTRARPYLEELGVALHLEGDRLDRRVLAIAESDDNDPRLVERHERGGMGLDAVWSDDFHHALHAPLTGERQGYYQDFGPLACLEWAYEEGFVYAGQRSTYRRRRHGRSSERIPAERFVVYAQNHDQVGNRARSERLASLVDSESLKLAAAAVAFSPFVPLLFMGEEYGETAPFPYFTDHGNPGLAEAVREGREAEFAAFDWEVEIPDPQAEETFEAARISWDDRDEPGHARLLAYHRELLRLRKAVAALATLKKSRTRAESSDEDGWLIVRRRAPGCDAVLVLHFGEEAAEVPVELGEGAWKREIDSAEERWGGPGSRVPEHLAVEGEGPVRLEVRPRSAVLITRG